MSTIVTRAGKGSALTHNEVDANFTNLNTDKLQSGNTAASLIITSLSGTTVTYTNANISSATISGGTITGITDLSVADGGTGSSSASGARTNLGATTIGSNLFTLTNPGAITFPRFNADNTVSSLSAADFKTAIGTGSGTVTSVAATVPAFLSVSGSPITTSGTLAISYSGTALPIANGGSGQTTQQAAMNTFAGAVTSGSYLRGNGTNVVMSTIQAADVPTLNQNTTGSAATVTGNATGSTFGFNSGYGSVATAYGCRAWVNFNGTGTVAIRASGNVSSITDNGTGDYTVNFTTAIVDANYSVASCARRDPSIADNGNVTAQIGGANPSTTAVRMKCNRSDFAGTEDPSVVCVNIFR